MNINIFLIYNINILYYIHTCFKYKKDSYSTQIVSTTHLNFQGRFSHHNFSPPLWLNLTLQGFPQPRHNKTFTSWAELQRFTCDRWWWRNCSAKKNGKQRGHFEPGRYHYMFILPKHLDISGFSVDKNLRYLGIPGDSMRDIFLTRSLEVTEVTFWACFFSTLSLPTPSHPSPQKTQQRCLPLQITSFQHVFFFWVFWWVTKNPKTSTISSPPSHPIRWHWIRKRLSRGQNGGALRTQKSSGNKNTWGCFCEK